MPQRKRAAQQIHGVPVVGFVGRAEWMDMHKQIEAIGSNPQRYSPAEVDGIIDKFHSLDAPSGNHPSQAQWNTRQGN